jgi:hypothetical protein
LGAGAQDADQRTRSHEAEGTAHQSAPQAGNDQQTDYSAKVVVLRGMFVRAMHSNVLRFEHVQIITNGTCPVKRFFMVPR